MKKVRVFIGLREIAGYFGNLKKGFDELEVDSAFLNLGGNRFKYDEGKNPKWVQLFNKFGKNIGARFSKNFLLRFIWLSTFQNILGFFAFFFALFSYDVFVLGGNSTFFFFIDYTILKLFRKKIICVYLGSDSRPMYANGFSTQNPKLGKLNRFLVWLQKRIIKFSERKADFCINHPPSAIFHEKDFISWFHVGVPSPQPELKRRGNKSNGMPVRIIHAPSKKGPKGTVYFERIIERLQKKHTIEYVKISGVPHSEVLRTIASADIALDQFFSDTPMAVFATECSFQKVPVVVGSYYGNAILKDYKKDIIPPSVFAHPDKVEEQIEKLIVDAAYRKECGERAYNYVKKNWGSANVAKKYLKLLSGDFPKEWVFKVNDLQYINGVGFPEKNLKIKVKEFLSGGKTKALQLDDKPKLKKAYLDLINEKG